MAAPTKHKQSLRRLVQVSDHELVNRKINEYTPLIALTPGFDHDEQRVKINRAISMVEAIGPQDGTEDLLARQMVGVNQAIHECLAAAMNPGTSLDRKDKSLEMANKLSQTYLKQVAALDKHRGGASQKVVVEHVTVEDGGQAIVGNVSTSGLKEEPS